jgi:kynurenine formamidase
MAQADKLPESGATLFCIPMKIGKGTGAPTRIFALLP